MLFVASAGGPCPRGGSWSSSGPGSDASTPRRSSRQPLTQSSSERVSRIIIDKCLPLAPPLLHITPGISTAALIAGSPLPPPFPFHQTRRSFVPTGSSPSAPFYPTPSSSPQTNSPGQPCTPASCWRTMRARTARMRRPGLRLPRSWGGERICRGRIALVTYGDPRRGCRGLGTCLFLPRWSA